jgi:hypothetical protein
VSRGQSGGLKKEKDILFEDDDFWVCANAKGDFEIYRNGVTHATRCAVVGRNLANALERAKTECSRRAQAVRDDDARAKAARDALVDAGFVAQPEDDDVITDDTKAVWLDPENGLRLTLADATKRLPRIRENKRMRDVGFVSVGNDDLGWYPPGLDGDDDPIYSREQALSMTEHVEDRIEEAVKDATEDMISTEEAAANTKEEQEDFAKEKQGEIDKLLADRTMLLDLLDMTEHSFEMRRTFIEGHGKAWMRELYRRANVQRR